MIMDYTVQEVNDNASYIMKLFQGRQMVVWSWGAQKYTAVIYEGMKALRFKVSGFKHKGIVYVCYNGGDDLFEVFTVKRGGSVKMHIEGVYFDMIVDVIDDLVEKGTDSDEVYAKRVKSAYEG